MSFKHVVLVCLVFVVMIYGSLLYVCADFSNELNLSISERAGFMWWYIFQGGERETHDSFLYVTYEECANGTCVPNYSPTKDEVKHQAYELFKNRER